MTLARVARRRSRHRRAWLAPLAPLALFVGIGGTYSLHVAAADDCRSVSRTATDAQTILVCRREYHRTGDPEAGAILADAYRRSGDRAVASALAAGLAGTSARAEALYVLGRVAVANHQPDRAMALLTTARELHRAGGRHVWLAKDDQAIAGIWTSREQYAPALRSLDECIAQARAGEDPQIESYCHLSAAHVLSSVGYFAASLSELDRARIGLVSDRDRAWLESQRGNLYQDLARSPTHAGYHAQAVHAFEQVVRLASHAQLPSLVASAELNLAYSLAELERVDEAPPHLRASALVDREHTYANDRALVEARIAYRRGDLARASALNDQIYDAIVDHDDRRRVCAMQASIALASGDLARAELWARRGIAEVEQTRVAQVIELRSWILSTRREPYELLFSALARAGRAEQALEVFDRWQGRSLLDMLASQRPTATSDLQATATHVEKVGDWLAAVSAAPLVSTEAPLVLAELRSLDLLALVIAERNLWRVTIADGALEIVDLGRFAEVRDLFERFASQPTNRAVAEQLGRLVIPDSMFRATPEAVRVVLDGPLSSLPIAALRRSGRPWIAVRPIVRAPRISGLGCRSRVPHPGKAVVLADAAGDLPAARREAAEVAAMFATSSALGPAANRAALFAAAGSQLLHVGVHADVDRDGGVLRLADGSISAFEISARRLDAALVMLSACGSALSSDLEGAGSLASAFLAAGSTQVVATLRPISDAGAERLTSRFYRAGGVADPVRVLAEIQASLADTEDTDWPSFAVFGHDLCNSPPRQP